MKESVDEKGSFLVCKLFDHISVHLCPFLKLTGNPASACTLPIFLRTARINIDMFPAAERIIGISCDRKKPRSDIP